MENEKQPSYEEVVNMYNSLLRQHQALQFDKANEKVHLMLDILKSDCEDKVKKLATWHLEQLLAKPKTK